jgi:hypothetical protein
MHHSIYFYFSQVYYPLKFISELCVQPDIRCTKLAIFITSVYKALLRLYHGYSLFYCHHTLNQERGKRLMKSFNLDIAPRNELKRRVI